LALALTVGEPAGIGPELILALAPQWGRDVVVIGCRRTLNARAEQLGIARYAGALIDIPCVEASRAGQLALGNAAAVIAMLKRAADGALSGEFSSIVTAPVHKGVLNDAGFSFSGHTEFFAAHAGVERVVMLLVAGTLRVALQTTHLPLRAVADAIQRDAIVATGQLLARGLRERLGIERPRIAVLGLNPHAGEGGHLGHEDAREITPAIADLRAFGIDASGPWPADTAFTKPRLAQTDALLAMYHDQGLPVLKHAGFGDAVNVTLGLPYLRTSVDHGTALDLAGTGRADPGSLRAALEFAKTASSA
jgi:4-hydroxythreonine-4-phosphate dehydrogenase